MYVVTVYTYLFQCDFLKTSIIPRELSWGLIFSKDLYFDAHYYY